MAKSKKKNSSQAVPYASENSNNSLISNAIREYVGSTGVVYKDLQQASVLQGYIDKSPTSAQTPAVTEGIWLMDIAQSHHYAVELQGFERLKSPQNRYSDFLPVRTMNLRYVSYENMNIPVAIFGDFPLLNRKRVSTIDLTCYDLDDNRIEYQLRQWEASCFPKGRYVAYMDSIARKFVYRGYNVKGQQTLKYEVWVIPSGNVSISRDTSVNDAKMINFSLVVVGDGQTCASGSGKQPNIEVEDHGGAGDGRLHKDGFATVYANAWGTYNPKTDRVEPVYNL